MKLLPLHDEPIFNERGFSPSVLLHQDRMKVRRIALRKGARIPSCEMSEDVVFVVLTGRVCFHSGDEDLLVSAPGAVFIPGGAITRSMDAREPSVVLAVLCERPPEGLGRDLRADRR